MRVLQLHNRAVLPGGMENVRDADTHVLAQKGAEVREYVLENADVGQDVSTVSAGLKAVWNVRACRDVDRLIRDFKPDIAHVYTPFPILSLAVFRNLHKAGIPTVTTVQSFRYSCIKAILYRDGHTCEVCVGRKFKLQGVKHRCYHNSLAGSISMTAGLVLHSTLGSFRDAVDVWLPATEFVGRRLVAEGIPEDRIVPHPNTTPDPGFKPSVIGDHVLYAGRFVREKGIDALLGAWRSAADLPPLRILGDGAMRGDVERAVAKDERLSYGGWVDQPSLIQALAEARFLILPSEWYEGHPVIAVQALASGTPLIASDVGNFSEMVTAGENGYLFRSGDPGSLADVVRRAWSVSDGHHIETIRTGARRTYEETYSERRHAEVLLGAYHQAMKLRSSPGSDRYLKRSDIGSMV